MENSPPGNAFSSVPVEITVSVGKCRPAIGQILSLKRDSLLNLDRGVDDAVELYIGNRLIGSGVLEETQENESVHLVVRIVELVENDIELAKID